LMVPGAVFYSVQDDGVPSPPRSQNDTTFVRSLASGTGTLLERYWSPTVLVAGGVAQVWTPYDFHANGTFSHCGVDTFSLLRTPDGWRLAAITYTVQRRGCAPSPLGPPQ
ncbi:MAG: nuclear transport factor 2 family protein, partial [Gemmatimonadaceae bacterium]